MGQALTRIAIHLTFSTKNRIPFIDNTVKEELWSYLGGICNGLECVPIRIGGCNDHIHICCFLSKKITIVKLVEEVKRQSSKWIKTKGKQFANFHWQDGYGIFSVNPSELDIVEKYIENQETHHKKRTYQEELTAFLCKYGIKYDENYIWQ